MSLHLFETMCCMVFLTGINPTLSENPTEQDELNKLMIRLHNEARQKALSCQIPGQPQAERIPNLVSAFTYFSVII